MFNLVCIVPFHGYEKGQMVTDQVKVAELSQDREGHFVRVARPPEPVVEAAAEPEDRSEPDLPKISSAI